MGELDEKDRVRRKIDAFQLYGFFKCNRPDIKVASILDTFSYECFKYECLLEQLRPESWREQMTAFKPHFLFVESAWRGVDDKWRNILTDRDNLSKMELLDLIAYCKKNDIVTVFWGKEDPANYVHFIYTAKLFNFIFTTDEDCLTRYVKDVRHRQVHALPFAAQPAIHNPVNSDYMMKENVAFAGTWYVAKHLERQEDMHMLLKPAKEFGLHIFDRMHTFNGNQNYKFPGQYQSHIIGELSYGDMLKAYKLYKIFLNVNSVKNSPTMFSRRIFELLASGANIISSYSKGIKKMFGNSVQLIFSESETRLNLSTILDNPEYSQRLSLLGIREIHTKHLYKHRFNNILQKTGISLIRKNNPGVSIITWVDNDEDVDNLLDTYRQQTWENKELIIIKSDEENIEEWGAKLKIYTNVSMLFMPKEKILSKFLGSVLERAMYEYISFFHIDQYYAPNFLTDLMNAFSYTDADVVGKYCYYAYDKNTKALFLRNSGQENRFVTSLVSWAMIIKKEVIARIKLSSNFLIKEFSQKCADEGLRIYSTDKYNYVQIIDDSREGEQEEFLVYTNEYKFCSTI